jgi:hypothetical protein
MPVAILDVDGAILGVFPKPSPFHTIPEGGRMLPVAVPDIDVELFNATVNAPVPPEALEVTYTVTQKDAATCAAVVLRRMTAAIQEHLDATARQRNYDNILSAASYANSLHPRFGPEGIAYRDWRDACWDYGYQVLGEVQAGTRPMPSIPDVIAELPPLQL